MKIYQIKLKTIILILLTSFAFTSCSSDDDGVTGLEPENHAPNSFNLNEVADGATQPQLSWKAATDTDGDDVTYEVYLDTENPPQNSIANNLGVNAFSIEEDLQPETTYYWTVVATDTNGNSTESDIASFTSRDKTTAEAIVGKWFYESAVGQPALTTCQKKSFFLFTEDLFFQLKEYYEDSNGDCTNDGAAIGEYEVIGNDQIEITLANNTDIVGIQSLTDTELVLDLGGLILTLTKE